MKRLGFAIALLAIVASACNRGAVSLGKVPEEPSASPTPTASSALPSTQPTATTSPRMFTYELWFTSSEGMLFHTRRTEQATPAAGKAAVTALLAGPNAAERAAGIGTAIPTGTKLLGLDISGGFATVDLSTPFGSTSGTLGERLRLAQVVYTLTQFGSVKAVRLKIDGKTVTEYGSHGLVMDPPPTRETFDDMLPVIVVESPAIGDRVGSPVSISGTANVFEATVSIRILDAGGKEIVRTFTTATCGTGCRGDYSASVRFKVATEQNGVVEVFESSAKDGSAIHVVRIPVTLVP